MISIKWKLIGPTAVQQSVPKDPPLIAGADFPIRLVVDNPMYRAVYDVNFHNRLLKDSVALNPVLYRFVGDLSGQAEIGVTICTTKVRRF